MVLSHKRVLAAACLACVALVGCNSAPSPAPGPDSSVAPAAYPVSIQTAGGKVTITQRPRRIVSLSPTATEMLYAIGAGAQVVAVDSNSTYPGSAPRTRLSAFQPNIEAIASYRPDLVVNDSDPGGLVRSLGSLHIPVLLEPAAKSLNGSYEEFRQLGMATGHLAQAVKVVSDMRARISAIVASVPKPTAPLSVYHELDNTYYSATSATFIGQIYRMFGLVNIADAAGLTKNSGYPQLSPEYIISANPDLIFLADTKCCHQSPTTVAARPGWGQVAAVRNHEVIPVDDSVASRWGPRIVDYIAIVAEHVKQAESIYPTATP